MPRAVATRGWTSTLPSPGTTCRMHSMGRQKGTVLRAWASPVLRQMPPASSSWRHSTKRFEPSTLRVQAGEAIRFVVTNKGKLPHEFVIGTVQQQKRHEEMMQKMPGMKHEDANAISPAPGETKTLVWQFGQSGDVQIGWRVPGHYPAGMLGKVTIAPCSK